LTNENDVTEIMFVMCALSNMVITESAILILL